MSARKTMESPRASRAVSAFYIEGIKEGRSSFDQYGYAIAREEWANLTSTIKGFPADSSVGQFLRGERDFWANQIKRATPVMTTESPPCAHYSKPMGKGAAG